MTILNIILRLKLDVSSRYTYALFTCMRTNYVCNDAYRAVKQYLHVNCDPLNNQILIVLALDF